MIWQRYIAKENKDKTSKKCGVSGRVDPAESMIRCSVPFSRDIGLQLTERWLISN
jgi:hypothetical protein